MTGFPARLQRPIIIFCARNTFSGGISIPRSPRATMMPSLSRRISSKFSTPSLFSICESEGMLCKLQWLLHTVFSLIPRPTCHFRFCTASNKKLGGAWERGYRVRWFNEVGTSLKQQPITRNHLWNNENVLSPLSQHLAYLSNIFGLANKWGKDDVYIMVNSKPDVFLGWEQSIARSTSWEYLNCCYKCCWEPTVVLYITH